MLASALAIFAAATIVLLIVVQRRRADIGEMTALAAATSRAGVVMAETLGDAGTLPSVVRMMVPDVADWAAVHLVADHGGVIRAAVVHRDPAIHAEIERQHQDMTVDADLPYGPANVIRTGTPMFVGQLSRDFVAAISQRHSEAGRIASRLAPGSLISVPLRARTGIVGALTIGRRDR